MAPGAMLRLVLGLRRTFRRFSPTAARVVLGANAVLGSVVAASFALAAPPIDLDLARRAPSFDTWAASPSLLAHLADDRGKVSVLVDLGDLDKDQIPSGVRLVAPGVGARWLAPNEVPGFFAASGAARPWLSPPLHTFLDRSAARWTKTAVAHAEGHRGKGVIVGVVDTGLDVAHADLRDPLTGKTRVAWMLDYSRKPTGTHPELEARFGCTGDAGPCAILSREEIDAEIGSTVRGRDVVGHGTHVASLAAGNGGKKRTYVGGAPEADLIIARITRGSGESLAESVLLDAVSFVFDRADAEGRPVVTNISLGGDFGPHDGTSLLERGLASFVGPAKPGHALVVAAGNSGGLCTRDGVTYGIHTETRVLPDGVTRVPLLAPTAETSISGGSFVWINLQAGDDVRIGLEWNGRTMMEPRPPGESAAIEANPAAGYPYMAVINGVVGGSSPIQQGSYGAVVVLQGKWEKTDVLHLRLEGHGLAQLWVQGTGDAETNGACGGMVFPGAIKQGTVSVPATHPALLAVGCSINRTDWPTTDGTVQIQSLGGVADPQGDSACYFSGAGPTATGVGKPEITSPGAFVVGAMSDDARPTKSSASMFTAPKGTCDGHTCYVVDATHGIASGTSMSAPQVTGAVALLLEAEPTLTEPEIIALLQGGARRFEGLVPYEYQLGPGALDVPAALAALAQRGLPRGLVPAASTSWAQLSAAFARPDPSFEVPGVLELRAADGGVADGFDPAPLVLEVDNGFVSRPLTRQAPGVWTFSLSANGQSGGETLGLRARYGDVLLASRSLPIAADVTSLTQFPTTGGGCSFGAPPRPTTVSRVPFALSAAIALGLVRARRFGGARTPSRRGARTALRRL